MKKSVVLGVLAVVLVVAIGCAVLYVIDGTNVRKSHTHDYLTSTRGYSESEISRIQVKHSFFNRVLGYSEWAILVEFEDEPGIKYEYSFNSKLITVSQTGFTGGSGDKDELVDSLKHLER